MNYSYMNIFYTVATLGNISKAANELFVSQPAISQSIKKLESQLGGTLFLRSNKGIELTEEGKMLYGYIKSAMELITDAENEFTSFRDLSKGKIKIGCSTTLTKLVITNALKQFHTDYPNVVVEIENALTTTLISDLKMGKLDFVVFNESNIKENNLNLTKIKKLKQGFVYNPNFYADNVNSYEDLNKLPLILQKKESNSRKFLDYVCLQNGIILNPKMEVVSQELVAELTDIGLGVGYTIIDMVKNYTNLKELEINKKIPYLDVYLATNKDTVSTFATKKFIEYIKINEEWERIEPEEIRYFKYNNI